MKHTGSSSIPSGSLVTERVFHRYCEDLMAGNRRACEAVVDKLLDGGAPIKRIYQELLQRALYAIGEYWERNLISVASEHLATAVTEGLMNRVYARITPPPANGRKVIIASVENEFHQVGGKMVADIFELHGWDSFYLGANVPTRDLVRFIHDIQPDMLGLSLSVYMHLTVLKSMLATLTARFPQMPMVVGGQAFRHGGREVTGAYDRVRWIASLDDLEIYLRPEASAAWKAGDPPAG